ncbi:UvrB/UvrC motif-containing protein [Planobispora longispora]
MVRGAYDRDDLEARVSGLAGDVEGTRGLILALDGALSPIRSLPVPGSALSFLWPALARPGLRVIATATPDDYRRYAAEDPAAVRAFQVIPLAELSAEQTAQVLAAARAGYEAHHSVTIGPDVVAAVIERAGTSPIGQVFPGRALDLLDQVCAQAAVRGRAGREEPVPPDEDFEDRLYELRREKEAAIEAENFDRAAELRNQEKEMILRRTRERREGGETPGTVVPVTLGDVEEALALLAPPPHRPRGDEAGTAGRDGQEGSGPRDSG